MKVVTHTKFWLSIALLTILTLTKNAWGAEVATVIKSSQKVSLKVSPYELKAFKKGKSVVVMDDDGNEIGTYKVSSRSRKRQKAFLIVGNDLPKFKKGMELTIAPTDPRDFSLINSHERGRFLATLGYGYTMSSALGTSLSASYGITDQLYLGLKIQNSQSTENSTDSIEGFVSDDVSINGDLFLVGAKYFPFNQNLWKTIYFDMFLGRRTIKASYHSESRSNESELDAEITASNFVTAINVGNQWQINYFTIGIDWFAIIYPLTNKFSSTTTTKGETSDSHAELATKVQNGAGEIGATPNYQALILSLGIAI